MPGNTAPTFTFDPNAPTKDLMGQAMNSFLLGNYQDSYDVLHHLLKKDPKVTADPFFQRILRRVEVQLGYPLTKFAGESK